MISAIIIIVAAVVIDQITKYLAVSFLAPDGCVEVIPDILHFSYVENRGAAMGILQNFRIPFIIITVVMMLALLFALYKRVVYQKMGRVCVALIIAGGIGNLIDRVFNSGGFVVDFIDFKLIYFICPYVFNIADICVTLGCILAVVWLVFFKGDINVKAIKAPD